MNTQPRAEGDRGVTVILVALCLIMLMVFAAFAVDIGGVYAERRQDQTAADVAALAAVQDLRGGEAAIVATAKAYAHESLGEVIPPGADGWNSCARPDPAALSTQASTASCISYDSMQVRVRLPDRFYKASFGRVIGLDDYRHSAFAIAGLRPEGFGGVLPFFLTDAQAAQGHECLIADGPSDCDNITGSFAPLEFSWYTPTCQIPGNANAALAMMEDNIAAGIDHDLSLINRAPHNASVVTSTDTGCPATPNAAWTIQGNPHEAIRDGLILGSDYRDGKDARLQRSLPQLSLPRINAFGENLDNTPLWWFIPENYGPGEATAADIPASCKRDQFVRPDGTYYSSLSSNGDLPTAVATHLQPLNERDRVLSLTVRCFRHYMGQSWRGEPFNTSLSPANAASGCTGPCDDPVFAKNTPGDEPNLYDIQYSPRFGYAPQTTTVDSGLTKVTFVRFRAIYINRVSLGNKDVVWDPYTSPVPPSGSSGVPGNKQTPVKAFYFPNTMLPGGLGGETAPNALGANRFVSLVR